MYKYAMQGTGMSTQKTQNKTHHGGTETQRRSGDLVIAVIG